MGTLPKRFKSKKKVVTHCLDEELWDKPEGDDGEEDDSDEEWDGHEDEDHEEADKKADNEAFLKDVQEHDDGTSHSDHGKPRLSTTGSRSKKGKNAKRPSRYAMLAGLKDQKVAPGFVVRRRAGKMDDDDHKPSLVHSDSKPK